MMDSAAKLQPAHQRSHTNGGIPLPSNLKVARPDYRPIFSDFTDLDLSTIWSETFTRLRLGEQGKELFTASGNSPRLDGSNPQWGVMNPQPNLRPFVDKHLGNIFLEYFQATLAIFHAPTFIERLANKPPAFLHAVYAFAARHTGNTILADSYFDLARREVQSRIFEHRPDLTLVQTLVVMVFDTITNGSFGNGLDDMWTSMCVSMATQLKLSQVSRWENGMGKGVNANVLWREEEERRRTFWAIYFLDGYIGFLQQRPPYIDEATITIPLPCDDFHWYKADPEPIPSTFSLPPFEHIPQITSCRLFSAVVVFVYFMNRVNRFVMGDHGDGPTIERDFRIWYDLDPDVFPTSSPSGVCRAVLFSKLAPELVTREALAILAEMRHLLSDPNVGSGAVSIGWDFDARFPFFCNGLVFAVDHLAQVRSISESMEDLQLVLDVADGLSSKGWGMAKVASRHLTAIGFECFSRSGAAKQKQETADEWLDSYMAGGIVT
ncbi:hypothetical protein HDU93_005894 [Gonapodya sp. JEL0774]|nr:hypothetical protein HDU93_005894 [Gonapodya sp. JEL0774]